MVSHFWSRKTLTWEWSWQKCEKKMLWIDQLGIASPLGNEGLWHTFWWDPIAWHFHIVWCLKHNKVNKLEVWLFWNRCSAPLPDAESKTHILCSKIRQFFLLIQHRSFNPKHSIILEPLYWARPKASLSASWRMQFQRQKELTDLLSQELITRLPIAVLASTSDCRPGTA